MKQKNSIKFHKSWVYGEVTYFEELTLLQIKSEATRLWIFKISVTHGVLRKNVICEMCSLVIFPHFKVLLD